MDSPSTQDRDGGRVVKRRKLRKGTRSCWECKRRKVKCAFASPSDETCVPCRRRNTVCLSQEIPEELAPQGNNKHEQSDSIKRMQTLLNQFDVVISSSDGVANNGTVDPEERQRATQETTNTRGLPTPSQSCPTPTSVIHFPDPAPLVHPQEPSSTRGLAMRAELSDVMKWDDLYTEKLAKVSQALHTALPAAQDVHNLCNTYKDSVIYSHQLITRSYRESETGGLETVGQLAQVPGPQTHPVLLARWMLCFALFLQQSLPLDTVRLSECPKILAARLKDTAKSLVTTNEELFGTMESLQCILLEALFERNHGHFRRAWLAVRRAMTAAQLMNLHRPQNLSTKTLEPNCTINPRYVWFRIIYMDRFICLMLGLPAASLDIDMTVDMIMDTPAGQLERTHTLVSKRILERNETDPSVDDYAMTEAIDAELLTAAEKLPHQFWQPLDYSGFEKHDARMFWEISRVSNQMYHFNLLNHLHLPYLLPFNDERYSSSKITCAHASREILTRWMAFRVQHPLSICCRVGDFIALRAGLTLCLAHLGNHHNAKPLISLRHQRFGDRSMMERTLEIMESIGAQAEDPLGRESADLLRRLLHVEADAAQGQVYSARKCVREEGMDEDEGNVISIYIPYFGVLKISLEGTISRETSSTQPPPTLLPNTALQRTSAGILPIAHGRHLIDMGQMPSNSLASLAGASSENEVNESVPCLLQSSFGGPDLQQEQLLPWPIASVDDWAFQGVDTAFFDSLMRGMTGTIGYLPPPNEVQGNL